MNDVDQNFCRLFGRIYALEQLATVQLVLIANAGDGDPATRLARMRSQTMLTVQTTERSIDPVSDLEADSMIDSLDRMFAEAAANLKPD